MELFEEQICNAALPKGNKCENIMEKFEDKDGKHIQWICSRCGNMR